MRKRHEACNWENERGKGRGGGKEREWDDESGAERRERGRLSARGGRKNGADTPLPAGPSVGARTAAFPLVD